MRTSFGSILSLSLVCIATPAFAQDDEKSSITINGGATVVSDYRFRGISQSNKRPAVQGNVTVAHDSGVYVGLWGSSVDDYVAAGADQEIDIIAGFKKSVGGATFDVGAVYYYYPGAQQIIPNYKSDFIEPYAAISYTFGPVTAKATANYAPKQKALAYTTAPKEDSLYGGLDLSAGMPGTPLTLNAHVGRSFKKSFLTGGTKYTDWSIGATAVVKAFTLGVSYVDTNATLFSGIPGSNRNITKGGVVGTLGVSF